MNISVGYNWSSKDQNYLEELLSGVQVISTPVASVSTSLRLYSLNFFAVDQLNNYNRKIWFYSKLLEEQLKTPNNTHLDLIYHSLYKNEHDQFIPLTCEDQYFEILYKKELHLRHLSAALDPYLNDTQRGFVTYLDQITSLGLPSFLTGVTVGWPYFHLAEIRGYWDEFVSTVGLKFFKNRLRHAYKRYRVFNTRDLRSSIRSIVRFLFKNMDDESGDINAVSSKANASILETRIKLHLLWKANLLLNK